MKDNSWLILAIRLVGLFMLVQLLPGIVARVFWVTNDLRMSSFRGDTSWTEPGPLLAIVGTFAAIVVELAMCCYLFFGGRRLPRFMLRDARLRCPCCAHGIEGNATATCPECGFPVHTTATHGA